MTKVFIGYYDDLSLSDALMEYANKNKKHNSSGNYCGCHFCQVFIPMALSLEGGQKDDFLFNVGDEVYLPDSDGIIFTISGRDCFPDNDLYPSGHGYYVQEQLGKWNGAFDEGLLKLLEKDSLIVLYETYFNAVVNETSWVKGRFYWSDERWAQHKSDDPNYEIYEDDEVLLEYEYDDDYVDFWTRMKLSDSRNVNRKRHNTDCSVVGCDFCLTFYHSKTHSKIRRK